MDYHIQRLEECIRVYKTSRDPKQYCDQIKKLVKEISDSNSMSSVHTDRLLNILQLLYNDQGLKWTIYEPLKPEIQKIWGLVRRGREALAASFYSTHDGDLNAINCIDLKKDVNIVNLSQGTTLYQWCRFLIVNGKETLYDPESQFTTIGEYFSFIKVPQEQLGISPYFELYEVKIQKAFKNLQATIDSYEKNKKPYIKKYYSIGKKVCCQFVLPFSTKALVSTAKGTFDTWSVGRGSNGSPIDAPWYAIGGEKQIFIPLIGIDEKKNLEGKASKKQIMLAQTALFT